MKYISTRGEAPQLGFCDAVLTGLARDGGLYVPQEWPRFSRDEINALSGKSYGEIAKTILAPFVGDEIAKDRFSQIVDEAYASFQHPAVAPLVQSDSNEFILELFHGPTMAFKDVAMQLLARLVDTILAEKKQRLTIVGATSGDTGGAAIEAFKGRDQLDIFILFPHGKVSDVQRKQMTSVDENNVHALAIEGNFDDCQALVKAMFNDHEFRDRHRLSGVNSINWGRIMAQIVYYFTAALALGIPDKALGVVDKKVSFCVPTGNFGDIFAGYAAKRMGLPIDRLIIATNENDILSRTLASGRYETAGVVETTSPSMDIQVSSNFERLLFEASNRDDAMVRHLLANLAQSGSFTLDEQVLQAIREDFSAGRASEDEVKETIKRVYETSNYVLDPHTAVGVCVARQEKQTSSPMVVLSTAHPAKFPDAVRAASGVTPALPRRCAGLMEGREHFTQLANDISTVEAYIGQNTRAKNNG